MHTRFFSATILHRNTDVSTMWTVRLIFLFMCFLAVSAVVNAGTYYVDSSSGNDGNNGISASTPWKTIGKVNVGRFSPGDNILFKRGCTWREMLIIPSSGTAGNPVTFGAYGKGAKPVISGADIVGARGWSLYSGNIYVTSVSGISPTPTQLYVDGTFYDIARYPNSGYLLATTNSSNVTTIIDTNLSLTVDKVVGASVLARDVPWLIDTSTVTAYNLMSRTLTLKTALSYGMRAGYGFYLQNKLWMLDSPQEWCFDPKTGRLYLWIAGGGTPSTNRVEVSNRSYGIISAAKNYVTIRGLAITASNRYNIYLTGATGVTVDSCDISGGQVGIFLTGTTNSSIRNNRVQNTLSAGIQTDWSTVNIVELLNNTVNNAGNLGLSPKGSLGGIYVNGSNVQVINNTITNSGFMGINIVGDRSVVQNNVIDRSCLVLDDCAGIYTASIGIGKKITGNTITNSMGNFTGTAYRYTQAHGIYLDEFTHDTMVSGNIVSNADYGIFIHVGYGNSVVGNSVYGTRMNGILINENSSGAVAGSVYDNLVNNNIFETISTGATAYYYSTKGNTAKFGTFDRNRYFHPNSVFTVRNQYQNHTLSEWQQASGQDLNSTDAKTLCGAPSPTVTLTATPATVATGSSTTLTWSSANAITCAASGAWSGAKPASGSLTISNLNDSGTYALTCTGRGGTTTKATTITVH